MTHSSGSASSILIQRCLDRIQRGDEAARSELLDVSTNRLRLLTRVMLKDQPGVRGWEETDDVLQNATVRLWQALGRSQSQLKTSLDYFRFAATVIRRELIDLARHYFGPEGAGRNEVATVGLRNDSGSRRQVPQPESDEENSGLDAWTEFHEQVERLCDDEREVFDLLWYQGLSQAEAAQLLQVSERTIQRRWQLARLSIHRAVRGSPT